jgi:TetR/AcrR family transcriptional regulator, transcriptional repressor for nem operon
MGRVSRAEADQHRREIVTAAARLFRERGVEGVSVAELMADVGLTPGGFYRQFESKDALAAEAAAEAFAQAGAQLAEIADAHPEDVRAARAELAAWYLSRESRDRPGIGCPATALGSEATRDDPDSEFRRVYAKGIHGFVDRLSAFDDEQATRADNIATLCTLIGALYLARATTDDPALSDEILQAGRARVENGR